MKYPLLLTRALLRLFSTRILTPPLRFLQADRNQANNRCCLKLVGSHNVIANCTSRHRLLSKRQDVHQAS